MATVYYYGDAEAIADEWTVTPGNVANGNVYKVTINGKDIYVTAGASDTVATICAALAAAINLNENAIPEFSEVTAEDVSTYVLITGVDKGNPIGLSSSATGGTATCVASNTVVATGPEHFDNADNYSGDVAPVNGDTVVHMKGNIRFGLNQSSLQLVAFIKEPGSGNIGLPEYNSLGYDEYRTTSLTFSQCASLTLNDDAERVNINTGTGTGCTAIVRQGGRRTDPLVPCVLLTGAHASNQLNLMKGDVGVAFYRGTTANWPTVNVSYLDDINGDVIAEFGSGVSTITTFKQNGGVVTQNAPVTTLTMFAGEYTRQDGAHGTIIVNGGNYVDRTDAAISTTLRVSTGGVADFSRDLRAVTVADCDLYAGGTILDPNGRVSWTDGIELKYCKLTDVTLNVGDHKKLTISNAA